MGDETVTDLLEQLSSGRVDSAWREFLARYATLIKHIIRQHNPSGTSADECYAHVCGALSDDDCRRLRSFRPEGPAQFRSWLVAVVSNLCVDWGRKEHGRTRVPQSIAVLPDLEQRVYDCIYLRRMSRAQCTHELVQAYPGVTEADVAGINARIFALLTSRQRWELTMRNRTPLASAGTADADDGRQVTGPGPGPDEVAESLQEQARLRQALARLPPDQRLLLRLRYEQDLTLTEVARLTGHADPFRANRRIQAALAQLAELMTGEFENCDRKTP